MNASSKRIGWGVAAALIGLGVVTAACGGDGGGKGSGVSGSKTVEEVTDEDAKKLCLWTYEQTQDVQISDRDVCEVGASQLASSEAECKQVVDACLKDPPKLDTDSEPECDDAEAAALPESCSDVTVSDYESCIRGIFAAYKNALTSVSCSSRGDVPSFGDVMDDLPKSCDEIAENCPEMLGGLLEE